MRAPQVLVVDDNAINLELLCLLLEGEGFEVVSARDAEEALAYLEKSLPDIFVLDVQLPGMSGLDLLRVLRARPETSKICAVIVTSYAMDADKELAGAAGCDWYFTKPIDTRRFAAELRGVYERSSRVSHS